MSALLSPRSRRRNPCGKWTAVRNANDKHHIKYRFARRSKEILRLPREEETIYTNTFMHWAKSYTPTHTRHTALPWNRRPGQTFETRDLSRSRFKIIQVSAACGVLRLEFSLQLPFRNEAAQPQQLETAEYRSMSCSYRSVGMCPSFKASTT